MIAARRAKESDVPQLVSLMRDFYAEASFPLDEDWAADAFATLIGEPSRGAVWLVEDEGEGIGHVVLSVRFAMEFGGLSAYVDDLYVRPAHRRKGAARVALDALFEECRRLGCRSIHVEVGTENAAAQALYRQYGLRPGDDGREQLSLAFVSDLSP